MNKGDNISAERRKFIDIVMRQSDYTFEEANAALEEYDNNYIRVLKEYLGINKNEREKGVVSINQETYKSIREHMDGKLTSINNKSSTLGLNTEKRLLGIIEDE